jgi:hypothetical protein
MGTNDATSKETVMRFTRPHRGARSRVAKLWVLTMGIGSLMVLSAPAAHAGCPLLDPGCLTETVEDVTGVVEETTGDVVEVLDHTVDEGVDLVEDNLEVVSGETGEAIEETPKVVGDTVDDVTRSDDPPVPVSETDPDDKPVGADRSPGREAPIGAVVTPTLVGEGPALDRPTVAPTRPTAVPSDPPGLLRRIGEAVAVAARQLSFPLALSVIVVAFVLFQNYLDRKDPKLAVAPIAADVMKFE